MSASAPTLDPAIVLETKLHPPPSRGGLVQRVELLRRLLAADQSVVVVGAPAGYGKTTLVAQYAAASSRPLAWLSLDPADADPVLLLLELATALDRVAPVDPRVLTALRASEPAIERVVLPGLVNSLRAVPRAALALDDLHLVASPQSLEIVSFLCEHVSDGALASGVALEQDERDAVLERTEGWPAGLYLAALALRDAPSRRGTAAELTGEDRDLVDYLSSELLSRQPPERLSFLLRTSTLDRFSRPT